MYNSKIEPLSINQKYQSGPKNNGFYAIGPDNGSYSNHKRMGGGFQKQPNFAPHGTSKHFGTMKLGPPAHLVLFLNEDQRSIRSSSFKPLPTAFGSEERTGRNWKTLAQHQPPKYDG